MHHCLCFRLYPVGHCIFRRFLITPLISSNFSYDFVRGCRDRMVVELTTISVQLVSITTKFESLNPTHGEVYSKQHYVIKFVNTCNSLVIFHQLN